MLLLHISHEPTKEDKVNYARDSNGSIKFLSKVSLADFGFTASEVRLLCWEGFGEHLLCDRTVSFWRSPLEPRCDVGLPIKLVFC